MVVNQHLPKKKVGVAVCLGAIFLAAVLFSLLFAFPVMGFWLQLAATTMVLAAVGFIVDGSSLRLQLTTGLRLRSDLIFGVLLAAVLYGVFFMGRSVLHWMFPPSADMIRSVYGLAHGSSPWAIAALLFLVVGPCEELFWRGFLQQRLSQAYGWKGVVATAAAYTAVHVAAGNPVLIVAALVCGTFWGAMFFRSRRLMANIVSHAIWAAVIFAVAPLL